MAVFGLQIVLSLVVFCFLTKLTKYYSFGRWLLCTGLFRYWPPNNDEFKTAIKQRYAKDSTGSSKSKKQNVSKSFHKSASSTNNNETSATLEEFSIPPDTSIELKLIPLMQRDVLQVKYVDEFFSLVDFMAGTIFIFVLTELYLWIMPIIRANFHSEPLHEFNLSLLWCGVSLVLLFSVLTKFVREYLKAEEGILCILFGTLSFLLAMCLQYVDEHLLHLNLKETYGNRTLQINDDDDDDEKINYLDRRFIYIVMLFALINAYQSMILFFPAFRFGQLQHLFLIKFDKLKSKKQIAIYLLTIFNFILPILSSLLWLQPIVKHLNNDYYLVHARIASIILCIILRLILFKPYIQMYLDTAFDRVKVLYDQQQSTTSRITNLSYQRNVTSIFLYVGVVASQYLLPTFVELLLCFYLKVFSSDHPSTNIIQQPPAWLQHLDVYMNSNNNSSLLASWDEMRTIFNNQQIAVLFSYFLFWHHTVFCLVSCGSLVYNTYMQRELRSG